MQTVICFLDVLEPAQLARAQAAWQQRQPAVQEEWEGKGRPDGFFDIPNLLELDDAFIDLVDSPKIVPMMSRVTGFEAALDPDRSVGSASTTGCMRVGGMSGRVVPTLEPGEDGYTWWHNDMAQPDDWAMPAYRNVKLFWWPWAVPMGGGAVRSPNPLSTPLSALLLKMCRGWCADGVRAGHAPAAGAAADNPRTSRAGHIGGLERPRLAPRRQHAGSTADAESLRERLPRQQRNRLRFRGLAYKCGEYGARI